VRRRRLTVAVPLVLFLGIAALFFIRLSAGDPSRIPSALTFRPSRASSATASRCRASPPRIFPAPSRS
jgi:cytochrome c biogenesis protein CcmG/thiol:disulfide interchange protein DsbE